jgi:hypothetical protein
MYSVVSVYWKPLVYINHARVQSIPSQLGNEPRIMRMERPIMASAYKAAISMSDKAPSDQCLVVSAGPRFVSISGPILLMPFVS